MGLNGTLKKRIQPSTDISLKEKVLINCILVAVNCGGADILSGLVPLARDRCFEALNFIEGKFKELTTGPCSLELA